MDDIFTRLEKIDGQPLEYVEMAEFSRDAGSRIAEGASGRRNVWRRQNPRKAGVFIQHPAVPAAHGNNFELAFYGIKVSFLAAVHPFLIYHNGNLTGGQAVDKRYGILAHKGEETLPHVCPFHFFASKGVGAVQHHNLNASLGACAHHKAKRRYKGIAACTNILDVIDHDVYPLKHFRGRFTRGAVEGMHGKAGLRVFPAFHVISGVGVSPHPVLRAVKCHKVHLRGVKKDIYGGTEVTGNAAGVGHKAHALSLKHAETVLLQDLDARDHLGVYGQGRKGNYYGRYNLFHISSKIRLRGSGLPDASRMMENGPMPVATPQSCKIRSVWRATAGAGSITWTPGPERRSMTGFRKG